MSGSIDVESKTIFGFWLYLLSDILLFAVMFATYAVLRTGTAGGLGQGELVPLPMALGETLLLLVSSYVCGLNKHAQLRLVITFLLGALFFGAVFSDLSHLVQSGNGPDRSAFLSAYFLLVGTLLFHIAVGLLWMIVLFFQIAKKGETDATHRRGKCLKLFWHFLNLVWLGVYSWVYLIGAV